MTQQLKINDKETKRIDKVDENTQYYSKQCLKDVKVHCQFIKHEKSLKLKLLEEKGQEEDVLNENKVLQKQIFNLTQSPSLQQYSKSNEVIEVFPSQSNFQWNQGFKLVKTGQDNISQSGKGISQEETTHNSSYFSPISYSDQQDKIRTFNNDNQYLNQSPSQFSITNSCQLEKEKGLSALKKNLFVNSTISSTHYSLAEVQVNNQINEKETSPSSQKNSTRSKQPYYLQSQISSPSKLGIQLFKECNNIILIQKPEEEIIKQQKLQQQHQKNTSRDFCSVETYQNKNSLIPQTTKSFNCQDSFILIQSSEAIDQIINPLCLDTNNQTQLKSFNKNQEIQSDSDDQNNNQSENITNQNCESLPYISFIKPELVLPGLGASKDSLYIQQTEKNIDYQQHSSSQNQHNDFNQIDFSLCDEQLFLTCINILIQQINQINNKQILENKNDQEDEINQPFDFNQVFNFELNQILLDQEKKLNLKPMNDIKKKQEIKNEFQQSQNKGNTQIQQQQQKINIFNNQKQSTAIEEQEQTQEGIITQKIKQENIKRGFQLSSCHLNSKKGFQIRDSINYKKSLTSQLKSQEEQQIILTCNQIKKFKYVCHYKLKENDINQIQVITNCGKQCQDNKFLQSKYKLLSPTEKSKLQVIDVKAIRYEEASQIQQIKTNKNNISDSIKQNNENSDKIKVEQNSKKQTNENKNKENNLNNQSNEEIEQKCLLNLKIENYSSNQKNRKLYLVKRDQNNNQQCKNKIISNPHFFQQSKDFNNIIQQKLNFSHDNQVQSPQTTKNMRFLQQGCQILSSDGNQINTPSSLQALSTLTKKNHNYSNISLIPQQSSSILSNSFMDFNEENDSIIEQLKSQLNEEMDKNQLMLSSDNYSNHQKINEKIYNKQYSKREKIDHKSIYNQKRKLITQTPIVSKFKNESNGKKQKHINQDQQKLKLNDIVKNNTQEEQIIGRKRKQINIKIKSFQCEEQNIEEEQIFDEDQNYKKIDSKSQKNRKKMKINKFIQQGCTPPSKISQLPEIIQPEKDEQYPNQIGNISRSNTVSSQQSTQPIYQIFAPKESSVYSALQDINNKFENKVVSKKNQQIQKNSQKILEKQEINEQNAKINNSTVNSQLQNDGILEDESSISDSEINKNDLNNSSKGKFDTKNLVKNFLNQFLTFVCSEEEEKQIMEILNINICSELTEYKNVLKLFFKNKKFNRSLLKEFIFKVDYRKLFNYFLMNRATEWINSGRMKDKPSHFRALQNFLYICQNHDEIKSWRFRYNFV